MTESSEHMTVDEMLAVIEKCGPEDFDGHVDWDALTFEQKL